MRLNITISLLLASAFLFSQNVKEISQNYIDENGYQIIQDFKTLLSTPNVAYDLPNINKNANYIKSELEKRGVDTQLFRIDGVLPIVFGYIKGWHTERTIALYVHYDGQPVDTTQWTHSPWDPAYYDRAIFDGGKRIDFPKKDDKIDLENRIYARSAGDDKVPIIGILAALDIIAKSEMLINTNFVFFFEGQEEAGSQQLGQYLEENRELLNEIDLWLFCDGPVHQSRTLSWFLGSGVSQHGAHCLWSQLTSA